MGRGQYLCQFGLQSEDLKLKILNCSSDNILTEKTVTLVNPTLLPYLPYPDQFFDLVLCDHFLFIESEQLTEKFHLDTLVELSRIGTEIRIYPLMDKQGDPSIHLGPMLQALQQKGLGVELRHVDIEMNAEGNALLRLWNRSCVISMYSQERVYDS
jgi:hypothetical protein